MGCFVYSNSNAEGYASRNTKPNGNFLVHRLISYNDKETIKQSCATANSSTLSYLPVLGEGEVILTGVDFTMMLLVKVSSPMEKPDSETPQFRIN